MKINKTVVALAIGFASLVASQAFALIKSPPEKAILPNGLRVIVAEDKSLPLAAVGLVFSARVSGCDNINSGLGNIYLSLMQSAGFEEQSRFNFNADLEKTGIMQETAGSQDIFFAACQGNADQLAKMLEALKKLGFLLKPTAEDFANAKNEALRQLNTSKRFPLSTGLLAKKMWKDLFPEYAGKCSGPINEEKLNQADFDSLGKFAEKVFVPNNAVLVVVGDVNASDVFKSSMQVFGTLQAANIDPKVPARQEKVKMTRKREEIEFYDIDETQVLIGFEAPAFSSPDMPVARLWKTGLSGINTSWVEFVFAKNFPELKNISIDYLPGAEKGLFLIGFTSKERAVDRPVNFVLSYFSNMFNDPPKGEELRKLIKMQQLRELAKRETRIARVYELGSSELMGSFRIADGLVSAYSRVHSEDMKRVAKKMFSSNNYSIRIACPLKMQVEEKTIVKMKTLDNGAKLIVKNFAGSELVGLTILIGIDSCSANNKAKRLDRLVAEMVATHINDKENRKLNRQLDAIGASLDAKVENDCLVLSARTQKQNLEELVYLLRDMMKFPDYSEKFFRKSKNKFLARMNEEENSIFPIINRQVFDHLYPGMNFYAIGLSKDEVEKISFKEIQAFYRSWMVAGNLNIAAVGDFDNDKVLDLLGSAFKDIQPGKSAFASQCPDWIGKPLDKTEVKYITAPGNVENAYICVAFRMKPYLVMQEKKDLQTNFGANLVISHVLFSSRNAILADELKKIDAYRGLVGHYNTSKDNAIFFFVAEVSPDKVAEAKDVIEKSIKGIPQLNISKDDIIAAGMNLRAIFNRALERSDTQASVLASFLYHGVKEGFLEEILGIYSSVSIDDVKKAAEQNFANYFMLVAEPEK
ncbi:MAG: hypothetical protein Kow0029_14690 [Candidatus Rifleibacteriota bacterium]